MSTLRESLTDVAVRSLAADRPPAAISTAATQGAASGLPSVLVVMGVPGSRKTTTATLLSELLHWELADADAFHSAANVRKMESGIALADEDRWSWLRAIAAWIDTVRGAGRHGVIGCSALKRSYRDILIGACEDVRLVYLKGGPDLIAHRMKLRRGQFMPVLSCRATSTRWRSRRPTRRSW